MPDKTIPISVIEAIPSYNGGISAIASANAPVLYFEAAPAIGHLHGIIRITLTTERLLPVGANTLGKDHVVVAHLRMSTQAALNLKGALESALLLQQQPAGELKSQRN